MESVVNGSTGQNSTRFAPASAVVMYRPIGNDGDVLMRSPRESLIWNVATAIPVATKAVRRTLRNLSDRPTVMIDCCFLKILDGRLLGRCDRGSFCGRSTWRGDQVTTSDDDFMDGSLHAVPLRGKMALLDRR